ncbi:MAG: O-antigen ligase family protein [bacterium]|nr:O-antigen ligase family protein [bacterium]
MRTSSRQFITTKSLLWVGLVIGAIAVGLSVPYINPIFVIIGIVLLLNIYLIASYPMYGLLAYLVIYLYRPGEIYPSLAPLRIELLLGVLVIISLIIHQKLKTNRVTLPRDQVTLWLAAFLGVMYISVFTSYEQSATIEICKEFLKILIFYFLIVSLVDTYKKFVAFMVVYIIMIGKIAFDAFNQYLSGSFVHTMGVDRLVGTTSAGGDPNAIAATMAITIPIVVATAFYARNYIIKGGMVILGLGMTYLITITGSRGGLLAFMGALIGGFLYVRHKFFTALLVIVCMIGAWSVLPDQYQARYETLVEVDDVNDTSSGRWEIWVAGVKMIAARPILGVGAGAFRWAAGSPEFGLNKFMQAHNLIIQIAASTGLVGLFVWFGFMFNFGKQVRRMVLLSQDRVDLRWANLYGKAFIASLIALFVAGGFGHNLYRYNWYLMAGMTVAMVKIVQDREQIEQENSELIVDQTDSVSTAPETNSEKS